MVDQGRLVEALRGTMPAWWYPLPKAYGKTWSARRQRWRRATGSRSRARHPRTPVGRSIARRPRDRQKNRVAPASPTRTRVDQRWNRFEDLPWKGMNSWIGPAQGPGDKDETDCLRLCQRASSLSECRWRRCCPGKLQVEEVVLWLERTDAHVGGPREGYALADCLRCKPSIPPLSMESAENLTRGIGGPGDTCSRTSKRPSRQTTA